MDRREFLRQAALVGSGVALETRHGSLSRMLGTGVPDLDATAAAPPASLSSIEHVVFLIQENRSYDHYFGSYRKGRGFNDHPKGDAGVFAQPDPQRKSTSPKSVLLPWHLDTRHGNAACTFDVAHEWSSQHVAWNGGKMNGFLHAQGAAASAPLTMGYYTRADLPLYHALADAFTLCDGYHCSALSPTDPNRHHAFSGWIDPDGRAGGPVVTNPPDVGAPAGSKIATGAAIYSWTTMPERLTSQGVSWKVYQVPGSLRSTITTNNILLKYRQYHRDPKSDLYQNAFVPSYPADFESDVKQGTLPAVSWVNAQTPGDDEHPPFPPNDGERVTAHVLRTLFANPKLWAKTVVFLTWDENGGFFDHVTPPTPPPGTPGEYVPANLLPPTQNTFTGPIGLGFRVPMLVISPFSRGGHINSDTFDHTSMLRFLETRFGVEAPNISAWRRATVSDLTSTLRFDHPRPDVPRKLPYQALSDKLVKRECAAFSRKPVAPPLKQKMPTQEH